MSTMRNISSVAVEVTNELAFSQVDSFSHSTEALALVPRQARRFAEVETSLDVKTQLHNLTDATTAATNARQLFITSYTGVYTGNVITVKAR